ncbi:hypothetical protein ACWDRB_63490 [Nonomuraea sp. NPDC003707]
MTGFLSALGQKLAERWINLLALPGLLYLAVAAAGTALGAEHAFDADLLRRRITTWAADASLASPGGVVLLVAATVAGATAVGVVAQGLGRGVAALWSARGVRPPGRALADWRRRRSRRAKEKADRDDAGERAVLRAIAAADQLSLVEADRPTWMADRLNALHVRVETAYGLDLVAAWPRLWLLLPGDRRAEITTARDAYTAAATLSGWGWLYLALTP